MGVTDRCERLCDNVTLLGQLVVEFNGVPFVQRYKSKPWLVWQKGVRKAIQKGVAVVMGYPHMGVLHPPCGGNGPL